MVIGFRASMNMSSYVCQLRLCCSLEWIELYCTSILIACVFQLGVDNAWLCPNCRQRQQGTMKSHRQWSLPDILVKHHKRFKQVS